jgi:hypothetical protein
MTVSQAEGLLADVALEGQNIVIKALLESDAARRKVVDRYNKLVESVNTYSDGVESLVATVNSMVNERTTSRPAPTFSFNFVRPQPITCTGSGLPFSNSRAHMANVYTMANATTTIRCE